MPERWLKIQKLFQRGVLIWDEALEALCEEECEVDATSLIGTREECDGCCGIVRQAGNPAESKTQRGLGRCPTYRTPANRV